MEQKENLSEYLSAYQPEFKFAEENRLYLTRYVERICEYLDSKRVKSLLSLGIGHRIVGGRLVSQLGKSIDQYTIIEGSVEIIENFKKETPALKGLKVVHSYFEEFSTDEMFDVIEMGFVLEHVDDPLGILQQYKAVLNEDGRMFIAVPNARSLHRMIGYHAGLLDDPFRLSEHDYELGHKRYFDLASIISLVEKAGLKVNRSQGLMLKPITADQMISLGWGEEVINALMILGDENPSIANCVLVEATQ